MLECLDKYTRFFLQSGRTHFIDTGLPQGYHGSAAGVMEKMKTDFESCPMGAAIGILDGKWKLAIVWRLFDGKLRFNELQRLLGNVTAKVLAQQLRELESDGIVSRVIYPEVPPRVDYELTDTGRSLEPVLDSLCAWGKVYLSKDAVDVSLIN